MDILKAMTVKDYAMWELNAKCVRVRNRQQLEAKFKRKARRILNMKARYDQKKFSEILKEKLDKASTM